MPSTPTHLRLPFFSRSSSSTSSSFLSPNELYTDNEYMYDVDGSPPLPITPSTPSRARSIRLQGEGEARTLPAFVGRSSSRSPSRPGLRKMPSWTSIVSRRSDSSSGESSTGHSLPKEEARTEGVRGRTARRIVKVDQGTFGASNERQVIWDTVGKKERTARLSLSKASLSTFFQSGIRVKSPAKSHQDHPAISTTKETALPFPPYKGFSARQAVPGEQTRAGSESSTEMEEDHDYERARRGSDWPPTVPRPLTIDLAGIPTFAEELEASILSLGTNDSSLSEGGASGSAFDGPSILVQPATVADISNILPVTTATTWKSNGRRADTPLSLPSIPRLKLGRSTFVPPTVVESSSTQMSTVMEASNSEDRTAISPSDVEGVNQHGIHKLGEVAKREDSYSPAATSTSSVTAISDQSSKPSQTDPRIPIMFSPSDEIPAFDLSIFSPRPPAPPVLRGLIDTLPISPLELPTIRAAKANYPTPVIPRNTPNSPIELPSRRLSTSIADGSSVKYRKTWMDISTALGSLGPTSPEEMVTNSTISSTTNAGSGSRRMTQPRAYRHPSSGILPRSSERKTSRSSISGLPSRRMSIIIRPPILPCPTPPSLLTSPKCLGSEYTPPFFSASPTSPATAKFSSQSGLPTRRGRGSLRLQMGARSVAGIASPSFFAGPPTIPISSSDIGDMDPQAAAEGFKSVEHIPTPGTFGLEGEAERLASVGINPYFA